MMTLRELINEHPEWADLPIVIYKPDGSYHYLGADVNAYAGKDYGDADDVEDPNATYTNVLVFDAF